MDQKLKNDISTSINWSNVAGIRDKISHNYRGTDGETLWAIIYKDLPKLKQALIEMIAAIANWNYRKPFNVLAKITAVKLNGAYCTSSELFY
ncbi:MAG: DUF86 domain-containing protein [Candidatus Melainabacteria bacterium]